MAALRRVLGIWFGEAHHDLLIRVISNEVIAKRGDCNSL